MRAAVHRVDVVGKGIDLLVVAVVVLNRDFDRKAVAFLLKIERLVVKRALVLVQMFDEFRNAALVVELVRTLRLFALVFDRDANAFVEKGLLAQALGQFVETKLGVVENLRVRLERDLGSALPRLSGLLQARNWNAANILLFVSLTVSPDLQTQRLRKKVDDETPTP